MKKRFAYIATLLLCVAFSATASAQVQELHIAKPRPRSYVGVTGGASFLFGNVTHTDYADTRAGFAKPVGWQVGVEAAYFFRHSNWGIGGTYTYAQYGVRRAKNLSDGYAEDFAVDSATVTVSGPLTQMNLMLGPLYSVAIRKFTLDFKLFGGITRLSMPRLRVDLEDNTDATFYQRRATGLGFAVQAGAGVRYRIIPHLSIGLRADFVLSRPVLHIQNDNRANNAGRLLTQYNQFIYGLNTNVGLAYEF